MRGQRPGCCPCSPPELRVVDEIGYETVRGRSEQGTGSSPDRSGSGVLTRSGRASSGGWTTSLISTPSCMIYCARWSASASVPTNSWVTCSLQLHRVLDQPRGMTMSTNGGGTESLLSWVQAVNCDLIPAPVRDCISGSSGGSRVGVRIERTEIWNRRVSR